MKATITTRPLVDHQLRDLGDAADVLVAVGGAEAEVAAEAVADVVAVEHARVHALGEQPLLDQVGDRRLARAGESGQPQHARMVPVERGVGALVDLEAMGVQVRRRHR